MDAQSKTNAGSSRSIAGNARAGDHDMKMLNQSLGGRGAGCGDYVHEGGSF
jgi:hypothetical protein